MPEFSLTHTTRPRVAAYQVMRYVDGPAIMLTCTRRGTMRVFSRRVVVTHDPRVLREIWDRLDGDDASDALNRAVHAGYDLVRITGELRTRAGCDRAS